MPQLALLTLMTWAEFYSILKHWPDGIGNDVCPYIVGNRTTGARRYRSTVTEMPLQQLTTNSEPLFFSLSLNSSTFAQITSLSQLKMKRLRYCQWLSFYVSNADSADVLTRTHASLSCCICGPLPEKKIRRKRKWEGERGRWEERERETGRVGGENPPKYRYFHKVRVFVPPSNTLLFESTGVHSRGISIYSTVFAGLTTDWSTMPLCLYRRHRCCCDQA